MAMFTRRRDLEEIARLSAIEIKNSLCEKIWSEPNLSRRDLEFRCGECRICKIDAALIRLGYK
jgi:hypothetical protein